jgi:hypothetical protein
MLAQQPKINTMKTLLLSSALMLSSIGQAATLTIVRDISGSAPLLVNSDFAKSAANAAADKLDQLQTGDILNMRTLGETGLKNIGSTSEKIKRHKKQQSNRLYRLIKKTPEEKIKGQDETNILYFLTFTNFDCAGGEDIFIITDGIESSSDMTGNKLVMGEPLPLPDKDMLKGCKLTMYGLGLTDPPLPNKNLKNVLTAWKNWAKIAGLEFKAIINP